MGRECRPSGRYDRDRGEVEVTKKEIPKFELRTLGTLRQNIKSKGREIRSVTICVRKS
jgi:hypothetical protein